MRRVLKVLTLAGAGAFALAACDTSAPYSNVIDTTGRGVGFSDYAQYLRAQEELSRIRRAEAVQVRGGSTPAQQPAPQNTAAQPATIGQEAVAAVRATAPVTTAPLPTTRMPQMAQPQTQLQPRLQAAPQPAQAMAVAQPQSSGSAGVSEQQFTPQSFGTTQQNTLVQRDFVPQVRVDETEMSQGTTVPNLFVYALSTTHSVGEVRYNRSSPLRWRRWEAACTRFPSQDLAQEAFLAAGGPERDPDHMDPDGDGFACWWDPAPFRQAARTARARE